MTDLLLLHQFLMTGLSADPLLCLASSVAWLDPFWDEFADEDDYFEDDSSLSLALRVVRESFPDIYVQAVDLLRGGGNYADLDRLVCTEISQRGIPLDNLEWIGFGIPMPAYGVTLQDPDFYQAHPDVIPIVEAFGIYPEEDKYTVHVPDCVYTAGQFIAADLERYEDEHYQQLSWLIQWVFSCSGNATIDFDDESLADIPPLSWDENDLAFAIELIEEANGIMGDALAGLAFLTSQPELMKALQHNVRRIYKAIDRQKGRQDNPKVRLSWPVIHQTQEHPTVG
jgi:hypothetical protein